MAVTLQPISRADLAVLADSGVPAELASRIADGALPPAFVATRALNHLESGKAAAWCGAFYIVRPGDHVVVGTCGFKDIPRDGTIEIGYGVSPTCRNQGFGTGAVRELCRLAFAGDEVHTVLARVSPANVSSSRVVEKLRFQRGEMNRDEEGELLVQWMARRSSDRALDTQPVDGASPAGRAVGRPAQQDGS